LVSTASGQAASEQPPPDRVAQSITTIQNQNVEIQIIGNIAAIYPR
jgi:hypothetical protein